MNKVQEFRLVWTRSAQHIEPGEKPTRVSVPLSRDEALRQFDGMREIKRGASEGRGRLRVLAEVEYQRLVAEGRIVAGVGLRTAPVKPYTVRVDRRSPDGWREMWQFDYATRERALRDFGWTAGNPKYWPNGTRRMTLLGPDRTALPGGAR